MNNDLISRRELLEKINQMEELAKIQLEDTTPAHPCYKRYHERWCERVGFRLLVEDAETVCDLDKVVLDLEELRMKEYNDSDEEPESLRWRRDF